MSEKGSLSDPTLRAMGEDHAQGQWSGVMGMVGMVGMGQRGNLIGEALLSLGSGKSGWIGSFSRHMLMAYRARARIGAGWGGSMVV